MNKRRKKNTIPIIVFLCVFGLGLCGCGNTEEPVLPEESVTEEEMIPEFVPELSRVKLICELSTQKCYFRDLAKSVKQPGEGLLHMGEKARKFWIEYTGVAEFSINMEEVTMRQKGTEIWIGLPEPTVTYYIDQPSFTEKSYVIEEDQLLQQNPITTEDQKKAVEDAKTKMREKVEGNPSFRNTATTQAQSLIENYIRQIGVLTGVEYTIYWEEPKGSVDEILDTDYLKDSIEEE